MEVYLCLWLQENNGLSWQEATVMAAGTVETPPILNYKQEEEKAHLKWCQSLNSQSPLPVTSSLQ